MHAAIRMFICICLAITLFAVAGIAQSSTKKKAGPPPKYEITGAVTGMAAPHRATVHATSYGKPRHTVTMTADGTFTLRALSPGTYTLRPTHSFYTFSPSFHTVAVTDHDVTGIMFKAMEVPSHKGKK